MLLLIISTVTCYPDTKRNNPDDPFNWSIRFPDTGLFGDNLLVEKDQNVELDKKYSLNLMIDGNYQIRVTLPESTTWSLPDNPGYIIGWIIINTGSMTIFTARGTGTYDCEIFFTDLGSETAEIEIFENNSLTPTRKKVIY